MGGDLPPPQLVTRELAAADTFVVLATDGVWDVLKSQRACDIVADSLRRDPCATNAAAKALADAAYNSESQDNIGVAVMLCHGFGAAAQSSAPAARAAPPSRLAEKRSGIDGRQVYAHEAGETQIFVFAPAGAKPGDEVRVDCSGRRGLRGEYVVTIPDGWRPGTTLRAAVPASTAVRPRGGSIPPTESHLLQVPMHVRAGDRLSVKASWGQLFMVEVPAGLKEGDTFEAELASA
jgi:hypothetical protein